MKTKASFHFQGNFANLTLATHAIQNFKVVFERENLRRPRPTSQVWMLSQLPLLAI